MTINEDEYGICEVFTTIGKAGGCARVFRSQRPLDFPGTPFWSGSGADCQKQLRGIRCPHPMWQDGKQVLSCPDAIAQVLEEYVHNGLSFAP